MKKKKVCDVGRSDFHRNPPRPSARRQTLGNRGTDHRHSLYNHAVKQDRHLFRQSESKIKGTSLLGNEDIVHQPGWDLWLL
ncbi:hypothetical protein GE21DRAFT_1211340 [Neurospora crassa]|nr:hypothetical protein GE21DRAFT_1211340 [Neurospora crassa]